MCIICFKPSGAALPTKETLETCFKYNPDGAGYAVKRANSRTVYFRKGFFDFEELYSALSAEKIEKDDICAVHFRIATNGALEEKNCHPFFPAENPELVYSIEGTVKSVLFHNGILPKKYSFSPAVSDTYLFSCALGKKEKKLIIKETAIKDFIERETEGSRILYIHAGEGIIVKSGNWEYDENTGCFFSNNTYKPFRYSSYANGWSKHFYGGNVLTCPECGETIDIKMISQTYDLHECGLCGALFDGEGEEMELFYKDAYFSGDDDEKRGRAWNI